MNNKKYAYHVEARAVGEQTACCRKACLSSFVKGYVLPDRESNPGLPRDRRRSSPLDYRGICNRCGNWENLKSSCISFCQLTMNNIFYCKKKDITVWTKKKDKMKKYSSLEPDLNQWPMDVCWTSIATLQSTALPTELSRVGDRNRHSGLFYRA